MLARMRVLLAFAALAACASTGGCAVLAVGAGVGVGMAAVQDRTAGQVLDDAGGYSDVKARLIAADADGFHQTHVEVYEDNLLLSGSVPDEQHRQAAETIARSARNIHHVYNELSVGERSTFWGGVGDDWIGSQIRTRLLASSHVRAVNLNIEVFHGNVYLMGTARRQQELQRSAEIASTVRGVRRVVSFVQVTEPPRGEEFAEAAAARNAQTAPQAPPAPEYNEPAYSEPPQAPPAGAPAGVSY
jgi:osmotically-inducible protein OsmY